ncbi:hypothetical protein EVAR_99939_1 [Eumeta japonica]|uniref:Uncharacterized protein n=1 Tax=Eumeta variegata TaxID=151549 RepID=A0A4C1T294_EUMVA|nr:hypothetical protein EVAR_99939_1 [Eumeta japonica]
MHRAVSETALMVSIYVFDVTMSYNSIEPAARTKNMTHAALPRSEAFHLRFEVQARARNERQRGTIGLRARQRSTSVSLLLESRRPTARRSAPTAQGRNGAVANTTPSNNMIISNHDSFSTVIVLAIRLRHDSGRARAAGRPASLACRPDELVRPRSPRAGVDPFNEPRCAAGGCATHIRRRFCRSFGRPLFRAPRAVRSRRRGSEGFGSLYRCIAGFVCDRVLMTFIERAMDQDRGI